MKKLTMLLLTALLFASCAHREHCGMGADGKTECAGCKKASAEAAKAGEPDCGCNKTK